MPLGQTELTEIHKLFYCTAVKTEIYIYKACQNFIRRPSSALDQSLDGVADIALLTWCDLTAERAVPAPAAR